MILESLEYIAKVESSSELTFFMKSAQKRAIILPTVGKAVAHRAQCRCPSRAMPLLKMGNAYAFFF
jgi:hypothetical protein